MSSEDLPSGYQDDEVFDSVDMASPSSGDPLSGYSSDDGGSDFESEVATSPAIEPTISHAHDLEAFQLHQVGEWNERFQKLVELRDLCFELYMQEWEGPSEMYGPMQYDKIS